MGCLDAASSNGSSSQLATLLAFDFRGYFDGGGNPSRRQMFLSYPATKRVLWGGLRNQSPPQFLLWPLTSSIQWFGTDHLFNSRKHTMFGVAGG